MRNRFYAASTLVFALVCVSDPALSSQQRAQPQGCGNLTQYIPRLSQDFGWTREQAIGALANFAHESRGQGIEQVGMPAGTGGFGWAQWTGPRRYAFMSFTRANGLSPASDAANYAFLAHELRTTFAHVTQRMRQARTAAEATVIFARDYEGAFGPGAITALASRHQWARALGSMSASVMAAGPARPVAPLGSAATIARSGTITQATRLRPAAVAAAAARSWYTAAAARHAVLATPARPWYAATARRPGVVATPARLGYAAYARHGVAAAQRTWSAAVVPTRSSFGMAGRPAVYAAAARSGYYGYWVATR